MAEHHASSWHGVGETVDSVAWVNAMRCQWPGSAPKTKVIDTCLAALPLDDLVDVLQPVS